MDSSTQHQNESETPGKIALRHARDGVQPEELTGRDRADYLLEASNAFVHAWGPSNPPGLQPLERLKWAKKYGEGIGGYTDGQHKVLELWRGRWRRTDNQFILLSIDTSGDAVLLCNYNSDPNDGSSLVVQIWSIERLGELLEDNITAFTGALKKLEAVAQKRKEHTDAALSKISPYLSGSNLRY